MSGTSNLINKKSKQKKKLKSPSSKGNQISSLPVMSTPEKMILGRSKKKVDDDKFRGLLM
jgi:hypothetical protein